MSCTGRCSRNVWILYQRTWLSGEVSVDRWIGWYWRSCQTLMILWFYDSVLGQVWFSLAGRRLKKKKKKFPVQCLNWSTHFLSKILQEAPDGILSRCSCKSGNAYEDVYFCSLHAMQNFQYSKHCLFAVHSTFSPSSRSRSKVVLSVFSSSSIELPSTIWSCDCSWFSSSPPSGADRDRFRGGFTRPWKGERR